MADQHPLRPDDLEAAKIWDIAASVPDPEIPVVSIADLGILRGAELIEGTAIVHITPTYSGCPAMELITKDVEAALASAGYTDIEVKIVLQPAWTTDWITETGRQQLRSFGIAPPQHSAQKKKSGPVLLTLAPPQPVPCPHCGSENTRKLSQFGSTSCKALYSCRECHEPFDYFKVH